MNVVVIGGGTGSFTVLRGLKNKVDSVSAVVSMFDSGGSTGVLRDEFGILPPGDVRRCLIALADEGDMLRKLFIYRFDERVKSHSFGNLFLTALTDITQSTKEAIRQASKILRITGAVLPVSFDDCQLCAELEDGQMLKGEANIDVPRHDPRLRISRVWLEPEARSNPDAIKAILDADMVVLGPGDMFTSIVPNLLVGGVVDALKKSKAEKVYVCNVMTKYGETTSFKASDHLNEIRKYGCPVDVIVCNSGKGNPSLLKKYATQYQFPVVVDQEELKDVSVVVEDIVDASGLIRHDSEKLAKVLVKRKRKS